MNIEDRVDQLERQVLRLLNCMACLPIPYRDRVEMEFDINVGDKTITVLNRQDDLPETRFPGNVVEVSEDFVKVESFFRSESGAKRSTIQKFDRRTGDLMEGVEPVRVEVVQSSYVKDLTD